MEPPGATRGAARRAPGRGGGGDAQAPTLRWLALGALSVLCCCPWPPTASAICPELCSCDDDALVVTCTRFLRELTVVDLGNNEIRTVSPGAFDSQEKLQSLNLEENRIETVDQKTFQGLESLKDLTLRGNRLTSISSSTFAPMARSLRELDLSENSISAIDDGAFKNLGNLTILRLQHNHLSHIPSFASRYTLPRLAELSLADNKLGSVLLNEAFVGLTALQLLDLSSNEVATMEAAAMRGLGQLKRLDLARNNLTRIPTEQFRFLPELEELTLSRNPLKTVPPETFVELTRLRTLHLSGCERLESIESGAFRGCTMLKEVKISRNIRLTELAEDAFDSAANLQSLDLFDNAIKSLGGEVTRSWGQLKSLRMSGNPFACDCNLAEVIEAINKLSASKHSSTVKDAGECKGPERVRGRRLSSLRAWDLKCPTSHVEDGEDKSLPVSSGGDRRGNEAAPSSSHQDLVVVLCAAFATVLLIVSVIALLVFRFSAQLKNAWFRGSGGGWASHNNFKDVPSHAAMDTAPVAASSSRWRFRSQKPASPPQTSSQSYRPAPTHQPTHQLCTKQVLGGDSDGRARRHHLVSATTRVSAQESEEEDEEEEDEYYYVSAAAWKKQDPSRSGKHIPVTVL